MTFEESLKNFLSKLHELSWERKATLIIIIVSIIGLLFGNNLVHQVLGSQQDTKSITSQNTDQIPYYKQMENSWTPSTPLPAIQLSLGQSATSHNNMQVTVYSAQRVSSYSYEETTSDGTYTRSANASNGKDFIILDIELKNIGQSDSYAYYNNLGYIRDSDSNSYHIQMGYRGDDRFSHDNQYISEEHSRGKIAFQVPSTAKDLQFCYDSGNYPAQIVCWNIPD